MESIDEVDKIYLNVFLSYCCGIGRDSVNSNAQDTIVAIARNLPQLLFQKMSIIYVFALTYFRFLSSLQALVDISSGKDPL